MPLVCGVDPGLKNAGFSWWRVNLKTNRRTLVHCERINFLERLNGETYTYVQSKLGQLVNLAIQDRPKLFRGVDLVVIEVQMARRMLLVSQALEHAFLARGATVVNLAPIKLKRFFGISTGNYRKNKRAAVEKCAQILNRRQATRVQAACAGGKDDDVADGILFGVYGCIHYNALIESNPVISTQEIQKRKRKRKRKRKHPTPLS
jgi:hypothetical protein